MSVTASQSPASRLFQQLFWANDKETLKLHITGPLVSIHRKMTVMGRNFSEIWSTIRRHTDEAKYRRFWSCLSRLNQRVCQTLCMMTSSNGNGFRFIGPFWWEPPVIGGFPSQRVSNTGSDVFCDVSLNKLLNKQSSRRRFETPICPLWLHCNVFPCIWQPPALRWIRAYHNHVWWLLSYIELKCGHVDETFVTGYFRSCHFDIFRWHQC